MVSEIIYAAGSLRLEIISHLVMQLHCLCMRYMCQVRFIHVSGNRMIGQGNDRLSRGSLYEGVMNGKPLLTFLPLGDSALERSELLGRWI